MAMNLDRPLGNAQIEANLLVELSADQMREHLALAGREPIEPILNAAAPRADGALLAIARDGPGDGVDESPGFDRLGQEIDRARLHGANRFRNVTMARE